MATVTGDSEAMEIESKPEHVSNGDVKSNEEDGPTENGNVPERPKRNIQRKSLAENAGSGSEDESGPAKKRARTSGRLSTPKSNDSPGTKKGRGRPRKSDVAKSAGRGRGRGKKAQFSEEEEEEEVIDSAGDDDFEPEDEDDDEDFVPEKKSVGRPGRQSAGRAKGRGRSRGGASVKKEVEEEEDEEEDGEDEEADDDQNEDSQVDKHDTDPNSIQTGQFLIEKVDLRRNENYPIWRLEGPNMLRKFEMVFETDRIVHKSLYAYSSWAQSMLDLYVKIAVNRISSHDGETVVEVKQEFLPAAPSVNLERLEVLSTDALYESYLVVMKALFNHALDSSFLKKIKDDNEASFVDPISTFDTVITGHVEKIEGLLNMRDEFKTRVKNCPNMKSIRRQNWTQTDQATTDKATEKGVRSLLMFGYGYDPFTLVEDKSRGVEVAQEIVIGKTVEKYFASYHGLFHFKFNTLKRCQDKVKYAKAMESMELGKEQLLNKCLEDNAWLLQLFEDLKLLMDY